MSLRCRFTTQPTPHNPRKASATTLGAPACRRPPRATARTHTRASPDARQIPRPQRPCAGTVHCECSFAREADRLAAGAQTQNQITTMPSELPGVTAIDIGNKNVATGKNDIESTSTGLKKKVTLGLLLVLLIAAVGARSTDGGVARRWAISS